MSRVDRVRIPLTLDGVENGALLIQVIPSSSKPALWDFRGEQDFDPTLSPIQVLELEEYIFLVELPIEARLVTSDRPELFNPDYEHGAIGRFRPGLNVGQINATFYSDGVQLGVVSFEVLSRKISYKSDYRAMLNDIAALLTDLIAERFASSEQKFRPSSGVPTANLYQQFEFIRAYTTSEDFSAAMAIIFKYPDRNWQRVEALDNPERGIRGSSGLLRSIMAPGPRKPIPDHPTLTSVPMVVRRQGFMQDEDTPENQFVAQTLRLWRDLALEVAVRVGEMSSSPARARGFAETSEVIARLEEALSGNLFSALSPLSSWPASSTVLQRKEGYRDIYRAYLQSQFGASLAWSGIEDVYGAGKKNVALLYEYWCFLQLCSLVAGFCNSTPVNFNSLIERTPEGLNLRLRQGKRVAIAGVNDRGGIRVRLALFYNKSFVTSALGHEGSWTREMVPDFSLRIMALNNEMPTTTWLHFDAKYRVDTVAELFGNNAESERGRIKDGVRYKRDDLLRMHAYKDAVRRSTGAYILFPGNDSTLFREFHEIVPGIGAFALRPTESGSLGTEQVKTFISDVIGVLAQKQ
ncbi:MAG TPA: DUF2357 domain-containing protein [Candidatus Angelobacter sp.]|jgi:hypothetical protein